MSEHRKCSRIVKRGKKSSACKRKIKGVFGVSKLAMCAQHLKEAEKEQNSGWCRMDPKEAREMEEIDSRPCYYCGKHANGNTCEKCLDTPMCEECFWPPYTCIWCREEEERSEESE